MNDRLTKCENSTVDRHYGHPLRRLQHLIRHEGYHHGQIKLTLELAERPLPADDAGLGMWDVWMLKH
jgi:uncharacterized damage-inducible protein DinB